MLVQLERLEAFADPDALDASQHTPLAAAALARQWEVGKLLLEHGCGSTGPSGDLAFREAQRASAVLERRESSERELLQGKKAMELLDLLFTRRELRGVEPRLPHTCMQNVYMQII